MPGDRQAVLEVRDLDTYYGRAHILHGLSLGVAAGEVVALMGRNGAGKSTALKAIMGLVPAAGGGISFRGQSILGWPAYRVARAGLGYVPEDRRIFADLTVEENLEVGRARPRQGHAPWTRERLYALFPNLAEIAGRRADRISGGEQQMLSLARTLMGNPTAILLDEPSEGLAPVIVAQMARAIHALKEEGLSVLFSEQNLYFAAEIGDRAYVLESGAVKFEGPMARLLDDERLRRAHLSV
jgi:branched-chain amino acid transport system ATP-binding protein